MRIPLKAKIVILSLVISGVITGTLSYWYYENSRAEVEHRFGLTLQNIARTVAVSVNGAEHQVIREAGDEKTKEFKKIRKYLRRVMKANGLSPKTLYTFRVRRDRSLTFAVMLQKRPFIGNAYEHPEQVRAVVSQVLKGKSVRTPLYTDRHGSWISGLAPIKLKGKVVGVVEADYQIDKFIAEMEAKAQMLIGAALIMLLLGVALSYVMAARISRPIKALTEAAVQMRNGNYKVSVSIDTHDEIRELADSFNSMSAKVAGLTEHVHNEVNNNANSVDESAVVVRDVSDKLRVAANEQAASIEEATAAINHIHEVMLNIEKSSVEQKNQTQTASNLSSALTDEFESLHKNLSEAFDFALKTNEQAKRSNKIIRRTIDGMDGIRQKSAVLVELIELLNSISEKLQMLSLNATIEAARSGEGGSGFTVVANEITELSDKTTRSTSQAIEQLHDVTDSVQAGAVSLKETIQSFELIFDSISKLTENLKQLQTKSKEYLSASNNIVRSVTLVDKLAISIVSEINAAAQSEKEVLDTITQIGDDAGIVAEQSDQVSETSSKLGEYSEKLKRSVRLS